MGNKSPTSGPLPNGLDWADGLAGRIGTAAPPGSIQVKSSAGDNLIPIEELPGYPIIERGEQATITHKFRMSWDEGQTQIYYYGRGTILVDSGGNVTRVLNASIEREKFGPTPDVTTCIMTVTCESVSFDTPPDDFEIVEVELGVNIIKYPRYFYAFNPTFVLDNNYITHTLLNQDIIRWLQNYFENVTASFRDSIIFQLNASLGHLGSVDGNGNIVRDASFNVTLPGDSSTITVTPIAGTDLAKKAAMEIVSKYWHNEETPYIVGYEIKHEIYSFRPWYLNPGGYVEDPIYDANPQLPDYFWSPDYPPDTATIFDNLAEINPQCYSSDGTKNGSPTISWLRKADRQIYQRTWFKIIRRWIGSPVGFWDPDLYNSENAPWATNGGTNYQDVTIPPIVKADIQNAIITTLNVIASI